MTGIPDRGSAPAQEPGDVSGPAPAFARSPETRVELRREIGRFALTALVVNAIIGSGIFGLPDDVARELGAAAPFAYVLAALGIGVVMGCFAEVASRFTAAGGPYLYARAAFGRLAGIQVGWFAWLVRVTSAAANANLFVVYLAEFWSDAAAPLPRAAVLLAILGALAAVNVRGVRSGTSVSSVLTLAKLLPLLVFIAAGLLVVGQDIDVGAGEAASRSWLQSILALVFAFGGFEAALLPMSEAKDPRRDAPFALLTALAVVAVAYLCAHLVVMGAFPDPAAFERPEVRERPIAEAARVVMGGGGALLIASGVMVSTYGYLAGQFVSAPRLTFALAEQRDFPAALAAVHARFRTPHVSIVLHAVLVAAFAIHGSFIWNAILSAVARLVTYGVVCAAVPRLRALQPSGGSFRLPGAWFLPVLGLSFCAVIAAQMSAEHAWIAAAIALLATANWLWARHRH
jgi:amino acid transporter